MSNSTTDAFSKTVSTTYIVTAVLGAAFGLIFCIGSIVIVICIIKQCNKSKGAVANGMILQPYPPYPYNVPNYPPRHPPPYMSLAPEFTKISST